MNKVYVQNLVENVQVVETNTHAIDNYCGTDEPFGMIRLSIEFSLVRFDVGSVVLIDFFQGVNKIILFLVKLSYATAQTRIPISIA